MVCIHFHLYSNNYHYIIGTEIASLEEKPVKTIRHHDCCIATTSAKRCASCTTHRKTLFALLQAKAKKNSSQASKFTNHKHLSDSQKNLLLASLQKTNRAAQKKIAKLKEKLDAYAESNNSILLQQDMHDDILKIMHSHQEHISATYHENSFIRLFWESQINAVSKPKTSIRWHPAIIKWCIYLRHKSSSAYESLRSSGICLPSQRTLRDYTYFFKSTSGFSCDLDMQLIRESKVNSLLDFQKEIAIVADEMHIKEGLIYDKFTGKLKITFKY